MPVGVDVVSTARIVGDLERWGDAFVGRVLTDSEAAWCAATGDRATAVAACLAAKEAVVKVLGGRPRGFVWTGVELIPDAGAGKRGECRALLGEDGAVVGRWRCALDIEGLAPHWRDARLEAAAVTRGRHVIAVATT